VAYGGRNSAYHGKANLSVPLIARRSAVAALAAAWLWIALVTVAYLAQFSDYIRPVLALFG
jgi:hypothetical protein